MIRTSFEIAFYCRPSKANRKGLSVIELAISMNGKRSFIALPKKMDADEFNRLYGQKRKNDVNEFCNAYRKKIDDIMLFLVTEKKTPTVDIIKDILVNGYDSQRYTIEKLFKEFNELTKQRIDVTLSFDVYRKYALAQKDFLVLFKNDTLVEDITNADVLRWRNELEKRLKSTTAAQYMNKLKTIFKYAVDNNKLKTNPFSTVKIKKEEVRIEFLTPEQLQQIKTTPIENQRLRTVRDVFVLQANSGLSFSDLMKLDVSKCIKTDAGTLLYEGRRTKTGIPFSTIILKDGVEVLERYGGCPKISNQKMNNYLKELAVVSHIPDSITLHTHLARKTYATTLLNKGVSISVVARTLGHSNTNITQKVYAALRKETVVNEINKAFDNEL